MAGTVELEAGGIVVLLQGSFLCLWGGVHFMSVHKFILRHTKSDGWCQAIIWTNDGMIYCPIYVSLCLTELNPCKNFSEI